MGVTLDPVNITHVMQCSACHHVASLEAAVGSGHA